MRLVIGDALHALADLGSGALRLDANGFLGVEKSAEDCPAWSEGHPLSEAANHLIASMVRKMGGFTFQELNLTIDDIKAMGEAGADLSYDFVTRPAYHHALVTGDTEFLRLTLRPRAASSAIDPASLVHALQNHDELTHELVHFATRHKDDVFTFRRRGDHRRRRWRSASAATCRAPHRAERALQPHVHDQRHRLHDRDASSPRRSASATSTQIDAAEIAQVQRGRTCCWRCSTRCSPGVFALSGWDLAGMLTLDPADASPTSSPTATRAGSTAARTT